MFGTSPHPEHQNVPLWACSGVPSSPPSFRTPESAHVGTFWCSCASPLVLNIRTSPHGLILMFGHPSPSLTPERTHMGLFWCLHPSPLPLPHLEHQNEPTQARSGARAPPLSLSLILNTRTSLCGHVLVLAYLPSPSPSSQTPEHVPQGPVFGVRRVLCLPLMSNTMNMPSWACL